MNVFGFALVQSWKGDLKKPRTRGTVTMYANPDIILKLESLISSTFYQKQLEQKISKREYDGHDLIQIEDSFNVSTENHSAYQEYFAYSADVLGIGRIQTWRDALSAYERLLEAA